MPSEASSGKTMGKGVMRVTGRRGSSRIHIVIMVIAVALVTIQCGRFGEHAGHAAQESGPAIDYYTCSMHPFVHEEKPGNCPVCGMKLQPVYQSQGAGDTGVHAAGTVRISLDEERLLGVRAVPVRRGRLGGEIRTIGRIEIDESRLQHVHTRFDGWIERLFVNTTGQAVRRGEPLFSIYAPALVAAQEEYLLALRAQRALGAAANEEARQQAGRLVDAAHERLHLWNLPDESIAELGSAGVAARSVVIRSPVSGVVITRNITAGQQVMPNTDMLIIADLSGVWLVADVFERDLPRLGDGQGVTATFAAVPGREFTGKITFVYPYLDEATRTNRVRITLDNPDRSLKPGLFGDVVIATQATDTGLLVPADAVLITGERNIVFKKTGPGVYAPVPVTLGNSSGGYYEIRAGLNEGDEVVERGNFFLDSESQLRSTGTTSDTPATSGHAGH